MPGKKKDKKQKGKSEETFSLQRLQKKAASSLNDPVWRLITFILGGSFLTWILRIILGSKSGFSVWCVALAALATWGAIIRMLLLETKFKKFWVMLLTLGFIFLIVAAAVPEFVYVSGTIAFVFLLFRRYKPFRHLTSKRRAAYFMLGLVVITLLTVGFPGGQKNTAEEALSEVISGEASEHEMTKRFEVNLAKYSVWSLRLFFFLSLFNLFFAIRLQFMKIRPKLAVSSFLITVVPLFLVIAMGLLIIYSTLGLNRATRAQIIFTDWAEIAALDENFIPVLSNTSFVYENGETGTSQGTLLPWFQEFLDALISDSRAESPWAGDQISRYLWIDQELWLIAVNRSTEHSLRISGGLVDEKMMNRMANILHSDVKLSLTNPISFEVLGEEKVIGLKTENTAPQKREISGTYVKVDTIKTPSDEKDSSLLEKKLYSGMSQLDIISFISGEFKDHTILLLTQGSLENFILDLISEKNPLSVVLLVGLVFMGFALLTLEIFALYFGVRITGGITSAVRTLQRGTRRVAKGDLDAYIEIPNEDELGDLAVSFNKMTAALKIGQEEALAREHLERELKTAREIQEKLLPNEMPQIPGFEITGTNIPSLQVGGDYFDFIEMESGHLGIAIGDVCGKGIPAALLMANLQASLHGQAVGPKEITSLITRMNDLLVRSTDSNMFATFFYGVLDRSLSTFTSTNAGHNPPLHFKENGDHTKLTANGLIIGFLPKQKYKQHTSHIEPGDVLVLYTDGITEAVKSVSEGDEDKYFGETRLVNLIKKNLHMSAREIQSIILETISDFTAGTPQNDDITLVVIKRAKISRI
ncbi:SpoIIE family protein phosphatase [Acidobacteriota bacterium]